jgi:hypothetical protein
VSAFLQLHADKLAALAVVVLVFGLACLATWGAGDVEQDNDDDDDPPLGI